MVTCRRTEELIEHHKVPKEGSKPIHFDKAYPQNYWNQIRLLFWKNNLVYWRTPQYNAVRIAFTIIFGLLVSFLLPLTKVLHYWIVSHTLQRLPATSSFESAMGSKQFLQKLCTHCGQIKVISICFMSG